MVFLLSYFKVSEHAEREAEFAAAHREHVLGAAESGALVLAGSLFDPDDGQALLVFQDQGSARAFAEQDPYVVNGIVARWEVHHWEVVIGNERLDSTGGEEFSA